MLLTDEMNGTSETYDYVIVGAGSAGATLAARLSENGIHSVLLLEAGGAYKGQAVTIPAAFSKTFKDPAYDWDYQTVPQEGLDNRSIYWPRGKVLGGSSSTNAQMWVRGFAADYDGWAELAGPGWSWEQVQRLLGKVEVSIEHQRDPRAQTEAFLKAARETGYGTESANRHAPGGFTQTMVTQRQGARSSTATAYLNPAKSRKNLTVRTGAHTTQVLFDAPNDSSPPHANGVAYRHEGRRRTQGSRALWRCRQYPAAADALWHR